MVSPNIQALWAYLFEPGVVHWAYILKYISPCKNPSICIGKKRVENNSSETMVSSKKPNQEKKPKNGDGLNTRSSGSKTKKKTANKAKLKDVAEKEPEVHEISESSSSEGRRDEPKESNGVVVSEDAKMVRFPMNRIRRIMRSDNSAPQIMQDAVFLVNKATVY